MWDSWLKQKHINTWVTDERRLVLHMYPCKAQQPKQCTWSLFIAFSMSILFQKDAAVIATPHIPFHYKTHNSFILHWQKFVTKGGEMVVQSKLTLPFSTFLDVKWRTEQKNCSGSTWFLPVWLLGCLFSTPRFRRRSLLDADQRPQARQCYTTSYHPLGSDILVSFVFKPTFWSH